MHPKRGRDPIAPVDLDDATRRVEAAFLGSVCGCVLGKPIEINPTLDELRVALEKIGEWPVHDYIPETIHMKGGLRPLHWTWPETTRGNIRWAAPDDDINYTITGMLLLEKHGLALEPKHVRDLWVVNIPPLWSWGPERTMIVKAGPVPGGRNWRRNWPIVMRASPTAERACTERCSPRRRSAWRWSNIATRCACSTSRCNTSRGRAAFTKSSATA
jgi:hypothetical protein